MQGPPLIVVQDAAHGCAIIQHHLPSAFLSLGLGDTGRLTLGLRRPGRDRGALCSQHLPFDRPQTPDGVPHLHLRTAVRVQHRLGHIPQEVVRTIAVWHPWKLRRDPAHERVLFVRHPEPHRFAQPFGLHAGLDQQLLDLGRRTAGLGRLRPLQVLCAETLRQA